jgi:hypothetical protein
MSVFNIKCWPSLLVFCVAGVVAASFAFVSVNLFSQAMACLEFLSDYGWVAIKHGVLWQVGELCLWGAMSLLCWLVFKTCEHVLVNRYLDWAGKPEQACTEETTAP